MALTPSSPIVVAGKTYDKYALSLAISPVWQGANVAAAVSMVLTPYRYDEFGNTDKLEGYDRHVVIANVDEAVLTDQALGEAMYIFMQAIQTFINAKGL